MDIPIEIRDHLLLIPRGGHVLQKVFRIHLVHSLRPARQAAKWGIDNGIYKIVRNGGLRWLLPDVIGRDDLFGGNDGALGGHRGLQRRNPGAEAAGVAIDVTLMDMHQSYVGVDSRDQRDRLSGEWILNDLGPGIGQRVGGQQIPARQEGNPHRPGEVAQRQGAVGPLGDFDPPLLHRPADETT
ncbi:MAG: hypothetical protein HW376_1728 [candidate division NC10 bacterium]|nr:hypothetical protein [candidate division NC10 bacterium]